MSGQLINLDAVNRFPRGWTARSDDQIPGRATGTVDLVRVQPKLIFPPENAFGLALLFFLAQKRVLGVNALCHYAENRSCIPNEWRRQDVYFWGNLFRNPSSGALCVWYLKADAQDPSHPVDWMEVEMAHPCYPAACLP